MSAILAFDIGGTSCRAALVSPGGMGPIHRADSLAVRTARDLETGLATVMGELAASVGAPDAVVIAVPGPVQDGRASRLPTLCGPERSVEVDFRAIGRRLWPDVPVAVCNDLTAAGYAFVGQGAADFLVVTLGSGVGAKLFLGGRPLLGAQGMGGEIGHWRVPGAEGCRCDCGAEGHLGAIASGRGALQVAAKVAAERPDAFRLSQAAALSGGQPRDLTAEALAAALHAGDPWTEAALAKPAGALGAALALCHLATGIEQVFVTGGFAAGCGEPLRRMVVAAAQVHAWPTGLDWDRAITFPHQDEEYGLLGAGVFGARILAGLEPCG